MNTKHRTLTLAAAGTLIAGALALGAAPAGAAPAAVGGKSACAPTDGRLAAALARANTTAAPAPADSTAVQPKATHRSSGGAQADRAAATALAAAEARKWALPVTRNGPMTGSACGTAALARPNVSGPGYAYLEWLVQYGQTRSYFCGPATVAEMSATVPGPSAVNLNQDSVASYMGTTTDGTSTAQMTNGLNHYVGVPDFGFAYYMFVPMNDPPTASQRSTFLAQLQFDIQHNSPVAGDAWEVPGGPHLPGHPVNQEIFHWFEIGGWLSNGSQVVFADSATTVWSGVPAYSVYDTYTLETILGGRGYIW